MLAVRVALSDPNKITERVLWLKSHKAHIRSGAIHIIKSGPFNSVDGDPVGALIVADVRSLEEFEDFSVNDPFVKSGVYCDVRIAEWRVTLDNNAGWGK